jgi:uncharacterized protein (TIGR03437 family)
MNRPAAFRVALAVLAMAPFGHAQKLPAFNWIQEVDGSGLDQFTGMGTDAQGNIYIVGTTTSTNFPVRNPVQSHLAGQTNVFVTKLDPSGNILYSTYYGGGSENPAAMTVDAAGDVYVTGSAALGFPTTAGTYSPGVPPPYLGATVGNGGAAGFLFKLKPDGSLGYSTYFATAQTPQAIAADKSGSVWVAGNTHGGLPATPGALQTTYCCPQQPGQIFFVPQPDEAFLARFDPAASTLLFATYVNAGGTIGLSMTLAVAPDGTAYLGNSDGIYRIDATGSSMLASFTQLRSIQALALAPDGSLYVAGIPTTFQPGPGAFQTTSNPLPELPTEGVERAFDAIVRLDPQLQNVLSGTNFYSFYGTTINSLALDAAGNVYAGGTTTPGLPKRTPFQQGFTQGFMSELPGDLTSLLFSSNFGDDYGFTVRGVAAGSKGNIILAGPEGVKNQVPSPSNIWVNSLTLAPPPAVRIDAIDNAASLVDGTISPGETILVQGAGFGSDAQLLMAGVAVPVISIAPTKIIATFPSTFQGTYAFVEVHSGGAVSNQLLVSVVPVSAGLFSANGLGYGQGYILNHDGTLNTPSNPAAPGDRITIYATGVGPVSFNNGYAVTQYPVAVFIDGFYCNGVAAIMGPVAGFPGDVYQLTVYVPIPGNFAPNDPALQNFTFPAQDPVILQIDGVRSQTALAISIH